MCSPALQTSGQYTFWLCLVESQVTLRTVGKIHRQAVERRANVKIKKTTDWIYSHQFTVNKQDLISVCLCICVCFVPVDVAMQPLAWAHLLLGQTRHQWGWMMAATS